MLLKMLTTVALVGGLSLGPGAAPAAARQTRPAQVSNDATAEDRIERKLETSPMIRKYNLDVKVENGVATLTGDVANAAQRDEAGRLAKVDGVTRVDNKIEVDPDEDTTVADRIKKGLTKTGEAITDGWITTKVKWFFVGEDPLKDSDINVDTKNGVVTLKGTVKTAAGRARAVELAKATDGVKNVVDQLVVK